MSSSLARHPTPHADHIAIVGACPVNETPLWMNVLPSPVRRRIPSLSLRRTLSSTAACHSRQSSGTSEYGTDSFSPPPSYTATSEELGASEHKQRGVFPAPGMIGTSSRPSSSGMATPTTAHEERSGVQWTDAEIGLSLLSAASRLSSSASLQPQRIRQAYIDGAGWILRGLPHDLTAEEEISIRQSLPFSISNAMDCDERAMITTNSRRSSASNDAMRVKRSALHQLVATITLHLLLALSFILPYIRSLFQVAYRFDRRHRISDRLLSQSVVAADVMSKRTIELALSVYSMNDGRVGECMREIGMYFVQGFSGGVYAGVGEGMQVLGLRADGAAFTGDATSQAASRQGGTYTTRW